jgi:hypothetical protein
MSKSTFCTSWLCRILVVLIPTPIAILSFLLAFALLFCTETDAINRALTLEEGENIVISIDAHSVNQNNEGQLVHLTGETTTKDILIDDAFNVIAPANTVKLRRKVEMYQWEESEDTDDYGETTYTYYRTWSEKRINSSQFYERGYDNPVMFFKRKRFVAEKVTLGKFTLSSSLIDKMKHYEKIPLVKKNFPQAQKKFNAQYPAKKLHFHNGKYYVGNNPNAPKIGDLRIRFERVPLEFISVMAKQNTRLIPIADDDIHSFNQNEFVYFNKATTHEILTDDEFNVVAPPNTFKLRRVVEMYQYQWEKRAYPEEAGHIDYIYYKTWEENQIVFPAAQTEYQNPNLWLKGKTFAVKQVKVDQFEFNLPPHFFERKDYYQWLPLKETMLVSLQQKYPDKPIHFYHGNYYFGEDPYRPQIGDLQIKFEIVPLEIIRIQARKMGSHLTPYQTQIAGKIELLEYGDMNPTKMFIYARIRNVVKRLPVRLFGFLAIFLGTYMTFVAFSKLTGFSIFVINWIISATIAASLSLMVIGSLWISYLPLLGIMLILIAIGLLYYLNTLRQWLEQPMLELSELAFVSETVIPHK